MTRFGFLLIFGAQIFSLTAPTLGLGGSSATISARGGGGLWVPNGTEPTEFFIRDANPALFSLQGIKDSLQDLTTEEKNDLIPPGYSIKHCQGIYGATPKAKECPGAEKNIVYNTRKGPPCVAFVGDSHMMAHEWTIAELAKVSPRQAQTLGSLRFSAKFSD